MSKQRAMLSLRGLALGDAFGERYFIPPDTALAMIAERALPAARQWRWTDDTEMASAIVDVLCEHDRIVPGALAREFARRYAADQMRGYGGGAHRLLNEVNAGVSWDIAARSLFGGSGSYGNGGAMHAAPIGGWFADDLDDAARQGELSAAPTHAHPEGVAGAIAIAVAAAAAWQMGQGQKLDLFEEVLRRLPTGQVRQNVEDAAELGAEARLVDAVEQLGTGSRVTAMDTVGFSLWCADRHMDDFEEAMWLTVSGLGDRDTTCAIVGGIVALSVGEEGLPEEWLQRVEPLSLRQA